MTPEETRYLALASDAMQAVRAWPEHAPSWWRLTGAGALAGAGKPQIAEMVSRFEPQSPQAGWFKLSALYTLTGNRDHLVQMGQLAAQLPGTDRWMAFAMLVWWEGLSLAGDRAAFRKLFLDTGVVRLLGGIGDRLAATAPGAGVSRELRRIAILAQHLSTGAHAGTAITLNLRAVLESAGLQTAVFSPQELSLPEMRGYSAFAQAADVPPAQPSTWKLRIAGKAGAITYSDPRFSVAARWRSVAQQIGSFDPDVVLFVGFWSPLVWPLRVSYPVVGMSLHALPPIAPVEVWLAAQPGSQAHWPGLPQPQDHCFPYRFWPSAAGAGASRDAVQVPQDAVLMVTTGHRLSMEMPEAWCAGIVALLDRHPKLHWLLVGLQPAHHARFLALHERVRVLPAQDDLAGWLRVCDVYVNPPRVGGGASVAMAMDLGLAVVSLAGSDAGDKIGALAAPTPEAFRARLDQWLGDATPRRQAGQELRERFREQLDLSTPEASSRLLQACELAQRRFHARQAGARVELT